MKTDAEWEDLNARARAVTAARASEQDRLKAVLEKVREELDYASVLGEVQALRNDPEILERVVVQRRRAGK